VPDDRESHPGTQPFVPDFDTGSHSKPGTEPSALDPSPPKLEEPPENPSATADSQVTSATVGAPPSEPITPVPSVTVPGRYYYLKWWKLVLVIVGVWIAAAPIGAGLFHWWTQDRSLHKTPVVFVVLVYVVVCTVGGLMLEMVAGRPLVSALAIAVMSAPFASVAAAAPFYGAFYCEHTTGPCLVGIIPY
jgi:hypothetical protein